MARQYVSPADKLARQILKAALQHRLAQPITLPVIQGWLDGETAAAIHAAVAHAVGERWLTVEGCGWLPTVVGEEIGRRSRAGLGKKMRRR
jgi:hypothetical protein